MVISKISCYLSAHTTWQSIKSQFFEISNLGVGDSFERASVQVTHEARETALLHSCTRLTYMSKIAMSASLVGGSFPNEIFGKLYSSSGLVGGGEMTRAGQLSRLQPASGFSPGLKEIVKLRWIEMTWKDRVAHHHQVCGLITDDRSYSSPCMDQYSLLRTCRTMRATAKTVHV